LLERVLEDLPDMVKIRLLRVGATKRPFYRIVALDERSKRNGRALEFLGTYDPKSHPARVDVHVDRVEAWLGKGAQLSDTVRDLVRVAKKAAAAGAGAA
jgi:small subunit ribosomal protein S16